jgi:hypothetical protein
LRNEYNIIINFQLACSPEVNALDLGIWISLQTAVERRHHNRRHNINALARTVSMADLPVDKIQWVFDRIPIVHQLIVKSRGGNVNVEERRGRRNIAAAPD